MWAACRGQTGEPCRWFFLTTHPPDAQRQIAGRFGTRMTKPFARPWCRPMYQAGQGNYHNYRRVLPAVRQNTPATIAAGNASIRRIRVVNRVSAAPAACVPLPHPIHPPFAAASRRRPFRRSSTLPPVTRRVRHDPSPDSSPPCFSANPYARRSAHWICRCPCQTRSSQPSRHLLLARNVFDWRRASPHPARRDRAGHQIPGPREKRPFLPPSFVTGNK